MDNKPDNDAEDTRKRLHELQGTPDAKPQFSLSNWFHDLIADRNDPEYKKPDWLKIGLLSGAAGLAGLIGFAVSGTAGLVAGVAVGGIAMSLGVQALANLLVTWLTGKNPDNNPAPVLLPEFYPEHNPNVISTEKLLLPEVQLKGQKLEGISLDLPHYNPGENAGLLGKQRMDEAREELEDLRAKVEKDYNYPKSGVKQEQANANQLMRDMVQDIDKTLKSEEINLRFARDAMVTGLEKPEQELQVRLKRLGISDADAKRMGFLLDDIKKIPGESGGLSPELKELGHRNALHILALSEGKIPEELSQEKKELMLKNWDRLLPGNQRVYIERFVDLAGWKMKTINPDFAEFFPKVFAHWAGYDHAGKNPIYSAQPLNPFASSQLHTDMSAAFAQADQDEKDGKHGNWQRVSDLLQQRLDQALDSADPLDNNAKNDLHICIDAFRAKELMAQLNTYKPVFQQELADLNRFKTTILPEYAGRVAVLRERLPALQKGFLLLDQSPVKDNIQNFTLQDVRSDVPKAVIIRVTYKPEGNQQIDTITVNDKKVTSPVPALPSDAMERMKAFGQMIESSEKLAALPISQNIATAMTQSFHEPVLSTKGLPLPPRQEKNGLIL